MDHLCYVEFDQRPEKFETANPVLSLHNLIGEAYIDIGGTTKTILVPPGGKGSAPFEIQCILRIFKRPWFGGEKEWCKLEGDVEQISPGKKPLKLWKIEGQWNGVIRMAPVLNGKIDPTTW